MSSAPSLSPERVAPRAAPRGLALAVRGARVALGDEVLFAGLDMDVEGGRWTCLLGPSGVGKTTLLRMIAGLIETTGESHIVAEDGRPPRGRIAYMAQQDLLLPWLTALDNVMLGARLRGERPERAMAAALLDSVGMARHGRERPAALSGGQRQRVALARTLMEDRAIVLMDEPFSALDAITRVHLQDLAARLLAGRTVLLVTHDPLEALRLGHRVHVMAGRPAALDAPLAPPGPPPRAADDIAVLRLQGELLARLRSAAARG